MEIFSSQIDQKIRSFQRTIIDLQRSLEFTQKEVDDLKCAVRQLQLTNKQDPTLIGQMTADDLIKELEERCNQQEDQSSRNSLQFVGVYELQYETWEQAATRISKLTGLDNEWTNGLDQ